MARGCRSAAWANVHSAACARTGGWQRRGDRLQATATAIGCNADRTAQASGARAERTGPGSGGCIAQALAYAGEGRAADSGSDAAPARCDIGVGDSAPRCSERKHLAACTATSSGRSLQCRIIVRPARNTRGTCNTATSGRTSRGRGCTRGRCGSGTDAATSGRVSRVRRSAHGWCNAATSGGASRGRGCTRGRCGDDGGSHAATSG